MFLRLPKSWRRFLVLHWQESLRTGQRAKIRFRFMKQPEYIRQGSRIFFREGHTKGVGQVLNVIYHNPDTNRWQQTIIILTDTIYSQRAGAHNTEGLGRVDANPHAACLRIQSKQRVNRAFWIDTSLLASVVSLWLRFWWSALRWRFVFG